MPHFSVEEHSRLKTLQEQGKQPAEIAKLMGRDLSSVYRHFQRNLQGGPAPNPAGRPPALSVAQVDKVVDTTETMVVAADGKYQVTSKMVRDALVSVRRCGYPMLFCSATSLPFGRRRSRSRSFFPAPPIPDRPVFSRLRGARPIPDRRFAPDAIWLGVVACPGLEAEVFGQEGSGGAAQPRGLLPPDAREARPHCR